MRSRRRSTVLQLTKPKSQCRYQRSSQLTLSLTSKVQVISLQKMAKVEIIWQSTQFLVTLQLRHHKEIINLSHKALAKRKSSRNTWLVNRDKLKPTAESHARSHLSLNKCRVPAMSAKMDKRSISMTISPNMMHLLSSRTGCLMDNNRKQSGDPLMPGRSL